MHYSGIKRTMELPMFFINISNNSKISFRCDKDKRTMIHFNYPLPKKYLLLSRALLISGLEYIDTSGVFYNSFTIYIKTLKEFDKFLDVYELYLNYNKFKYDRTYVERFFNDL